MGMHGKERGFIVAPHDVPSFHIPSDLGGFTIATYDRSWAQTEPSKAVATAVTHIRSAIDEHLRTVPKIEIERSASLLDKPGIQYPLKVNIQFRNKETVQVTIQSIGFEFKGAPVAPGVSLINATDSPMYRFKFFVTKKQDGTDLYSPKCTLDPGESVNSWVPIDPAFWPVGSTKHGRFREHGALALSLYLAG